MLIIIFVLAFLSYLIHAYTWIQYCEAYTKRAFILNGFVNCALLIVTAKLSFLAFGNYL